VQYDVAVNGRIRRVVVTRSGNEFLVTIDDRARRVNAFRIDAQTLSLLVGEPRDAHGAPTEQPGDVHGLSRSYEVAVATEPGGSQVVQIGATSLLVALDGRLRSDRLSSEGATDSAEQRIVAPMSGTVVRVLVAKGEAVRSGQPTVVVEAMKMENELRASRDGTVVDIWAREGLSVDAGAMLVLIQ
jgi:biotin carboxyl carrier protein